MANSKALLVVVLIALALPMISVAIVSNIGSSITPNDQFFTRSIAEGPRIDVDAWRLNVDGYVERNLTLGYKNIASLPSVSVTCTLKCPSGGSGTAVWRGVPLNMIIQMGKPKAGAREVVSYGADGYSSSLTLDEINDRVLLAYEMNGVPLPQDQGYPLRLVVPDNYGYKWVKWITHIEVVNYDYKGYWESRRWSDNAKMAVPGEWEPHAYMLSLAFMLCGLALISGYKASPDRNIWRSLPDLMDKRFHMVSSAAFFIVFTGTFIYWSYTTYIDRGGLFYTVHGLISGLLVALTVIAILTGVQSRGKEKGSLHRTIGLYSFVLYIIVMSIGILMGTGMI